MILTSGIVSLIKSKDVYMKRVADLLRDPIWQGAAAIVAILVAVFSLVSCETCEEPIYELVIDAELCGTTSEEYLISSPEPKTCRLEEFGFESWRNSETVEQSSGWRSGGSNQTNWCNSVKNSFISSRSITGNYSTEIVESSEDGRWTGIRHRQYNYFCKIKINWDPIYQEEVSPRCGMTEQTIGSREVPKQCSKQIGTRKFDCNTQ